MPLRSCSRKQPPLARCSDRWPGVVPCLMFAFFGVLGAGRRVRGDRRVVNEDVVLVLLPVV